MDLIMAKRQKTKMQITGVKSEWIEVTSGVPQGSVLGPVLFLIQAYINDLATDINKSTTVLNFADDTKIFAVCNDERNCAVLQNDITKLEKWANVKQMKFNVGKCKTMHLGCMATLRVNTSLIIKFWIVLTLRRIQEFGLLMT